MSKTAPRLGRGLSALISPAKPTVDVRASQNAGERDGMREIPLAAIRPHGRQPRRAFDSAGIERLAASIRSSGVLQPVLVREVGDQEFELVAGERRWRAAKEAGLERLPALVRSLSDAEAVEVALIENLQREDLRPLERAGAYRDYVDSFNVSIEALAQRLGESRANISNYLRILKLPQEIRELIESGQLGMGQARAVAGVDDPQRQLALARLAARRNLAVRQVEALARSGGGRRREHGDEQTSGALHIADVEQSLSQSLGLRVKLFCGRRKNSGRVVIQYKSLEEFDRIAERLGGRSAVE